MAALETLIRMQKTSAGRIERLVSNMLKLGKEKITIHVLKKRQALLEEYWRDFVSRHEDIIRIPESEKDDYVISDDYQRVEEAYLDQFAELDVLIENQTSLDATEKPGRLSRASTVEEREPALPTISLPTFSGDLLSWESFRDQFKALIHESRLSNVRKLQYLKSSLVGEAARMLERTPVTEENYQGAWEQLERRFGNKRVLATTYMRRMLQVPAASKGSPPEIKRLLDEFHQARQSLKALGRPVATWDEWFVFLLTEKLDNATRLQWELSLPEPTEVPKFGALEGFLETRLHAISATQTIEPPAALRSRDPTGRSGNSGSHASLNHGAETKSASTFSRNVMAMKTGTSEKASKPKSSRQCLICKGSHTISFCSKYKQLNANDRRSLVRKLDACLGCLNLGHTIFECPSVNRCLVCGSKHHTTLHDAFSSDPVSDSVHSRSTPATSFSAAAYSVHANRGVLLATARVRLLSPEGRDVVVRALLDSGSESSFLSERIAKLLRLKTKPVEVILTGYQGTEVGVARHEVNVEMMSLHDKSFQLPVCALVTENVTAPTPSQPIRIGDWPHIRGLPLADQAFHTPSEVDMLLGADVVGVLYQDRRMGPPGALTAIRTPLGWILLGPVATSAAADLFPTESKSLHTRCCVALHAALPCFWSLEKSSSPRESESVEKEDLKIRALPTSSRVLNTRCCHDLNSSLSRFWEVEELPSTPILTPKDAFCERHLLQTHSRDHSGRYIVRLPFRVEGNPLPHNSRGVALRLLLSSERRQLRDPKLKAEYNSFLEEYQALGHMEAMKIGCNNSTGLYLPHHAVWKRNDNQSKIRVVFNASFGKNSGDSLNDLLLTGPKLQRDLWLVITRWRCFRYALSADIVKMFRQILVHPDDRDWQRILWRPTPEGEMQDFRLKTVTYGTSPAPFLALRTLLQLADDEQHRFPLGAGILRNNCYVDDILAGADDSESLKEIRKQLTGILIAGGFPLDKWASNDAALETSLDANTKLLQDKETHGALGLLWHMQHDSLSVRGPELPSVSAGQYWTKRAVLSVIASLFDPMGWLAPVLVRAKIFIQDLWLAGVEWDEPLSEPLVHAWETFRHDIGRLSNVSVPRWVGCSSTGESQIELHGFCDASERAFAAAVYLAVRHPDGSAEPHLLLAKTKVAPIKLLTKLRLELCGALLLARLLTSVQKGLAFPQVSLFAWSDSTVALDWIKEHASRWPTFVAHRVAEIQQLLPELRWRYARSTDNPADLATRGITPEELLDSRLWWDGPPWLGGPSSTWPKRRSTNPSETHIVVGVVGIRESPENYLVRFSSYSRLLRVTARILRLFANAKTSVRRSGFLTTTELDAARTAVCRCSQAETFAEEIEALSRGKDVRVSSVLAACRPFLDVNGLIRVGGRLDGAPMIYDEKHPVVIGKESHLATLLVRYTHLRLLHAGVRLTTSQLFRQFWIPKSHVFIKQVVGACVTCLRFKGTISNQLMGSLPADHVSPAKPFLNSGVDYAGPILLRTSKGRGYKAHKGYIAVFVCLSLKAVHLEAVSDLTTNAFIGAFKRFIARRSRCQHLRSDNGTNFKGADAQLRAMFKDASRFHQDTAELLANDGTEWTFNPPAAPHHGGLWEAAVKAVKNHLKKVMRAQVLTFEELVTLLCQIEACLNSRPLCPLSNDPLEIAALTPGHFLTGEPLTSIPEPYDPHSTPTLVIDRWSLITKMRNEFWYRWKTDYLRTLQHRSKWRRSSTNLEVGALVIIKDDLVPPAKWPLARIVEALPGRDGLVRVVNIRTTSSTFFRPVTKVVPLLDGSVDSPVKDAHTTGRFR